MHYRRRYDPLVFVDRVDAGERLATRLESVNAEAPVVLGLPRGGVIVAAPVARRLAAPLSVLIVRKLGVPTQPELAFGAIAEGGVSVVDHRLAARMGVSATVMDDVIRRESAEAARRAEAYGKRQTDLTGRTVILVDDGLATGATMLAAVRASSKGSPRAVVVAVPVGARDAIRLIRDEGVEVVALEAPRWFGAVGAWYDDFRQITDEEVIEVLRLTSNQPVRHEESQP